MSNESDNVISIESLLRKVRGPEAGQAVDLSSYDVIAVSTSAGKDSQAMLDYVVELARKAGVLDRVVAIHSDLGEVEWDGTMELAAEQAAHYGVRFEVTSRIGGVATVDGKVYSKGEVFGSLLDYTERRGAWPSNTTRFCTSEFKRGPIQRVFTQLAREWKDENKAAGRACRILDCIGLRAQESAARAKKVQFEERKSTRNQHVDTWLPILHWSTDDVWARIKRSGVRHHRAYDLGMPRLSCVFCIFAPKAALVIAGRANRELLDRYVAVEARIDHTFRQDVSMADVKAAVEADESVDAAAIGDDWNM